MVFNPTVAGVFLTRMRYNDVSISLHITAMYPIMLKVRSVAAAMIAPPIMMPMAPRVGQSCVFFSQYLSSKIVKRRVKRRNAINIGTLRPPVPTRPETTLRTLTNASGARLRTSCQERTGRARMYVTGDMNAIWSMATVIGKWKP